MSLLTLFSAPKPFTDPRVGMIQMNAISSWCKLVDVEVLLLGDEKGMVQAASPWVDGRHALLSIIWHISLLGIVGGDDPLLQHPFLDGFQHVISPHRSLPEYDRLKLQQRNNTIVRLVEKLVHHQRQFILEGDSRLIPMTRAQLVKELNLHESTISRAVANKAVQLPNQRIIPMSRMFERSLNVRTIMQEIIKSEDHPLSDSEIVSRLGDRGYPVARRTVAKYRSLEGILPGRHRNSKRKNSTNNHILRDSQEY